MLHALVLSIFWSGFLGADALTGKQTTQSSEAAAGIMRKQDQMVLEIHASAAQTTLSTNATRARSQVAHGAKPAPGPSGANSKVCQEMWDGKAVYGADGDNACDSVPLAPHWSWGGGAPPNMCLRPKSTDFVSDVVRNTGRWADCAALAYLWTKFSDAPSAAKGSSFAPCGGEGPKKIFVDVGANIGACTMQMLARPDVAQVVSFEPNPKNLFYLTGSIFKNKGFSKRLALFPKALGQSDASHTMYMTPGNAGNTVLDAAVAANPVTDVQPIKAKTITLDEVFAEMPQTPYIHLMKIDAQGFEVQILKGGRKLLASGAVNAIHFELAPAWLLGEGTSPAELFSILEASGYNCHHSEPLEEGTAEATELPPALSHDELVHISCSENAVAPRDFFAIYDPAKAAASNQPIICPPSPATK